MTTHASGRLHQRLDVRAATRLVLVCAPAGSGKTRLVADWAADQRAAGGSRVEWLTLDDDDRQAARFVPRLASALCDESCDDAARAAMGEALTHEAALPSEGLGCPADRVVVVLEEFHRAIGSQTEQFVERLLRQRHGRLLLVVITRVEPCLGQQRLRLAGASIEICFADLALTLAEAEQLLEGHDLVLPPEHLRLLHARTAGWAGAIELVASALSERGLAARRLAEDAGPDRGGTLSPSVPGARGRAPPESVKLAVYLKGLPSSEPVLADYLAAEVYGPQPQPVRAFMDRVGLLDEVCGSLADALTGHDDGAERLTTLARAQLIGPIRGRLGGWYEWNPLVAAFLRQRLHSRSRRLEEHLHRLASDWYAHAGLLGEALGHALLGWGDRLAAAKLREWWLDIFLDERPSVLGEVLELLDEQLVSSDPRLAVVRAFTAARRDDLGAALTHARAAVSSPSILPPEDAWGVRVMATIVELYAASMTGGAADAALRDVAGTLLRTRESALPPGRRERVERALLRYQLGAFETSRLRYDAAFREVSAALAEAELLALPYLQLSCHAQLAELSCQAGRLEQAERHGARVLAEAERTGWQSRLGLTTTHLALAQVAMLRDDLVEALEHLTKAASVLRPPDVLDKVRLRFLETTAVCTTGKVEESGVALARLADEAGSVVDPAWVSELLVAARARHDACRGKPEQGLRRLEAQPLEDRSPSPVRPYAVLRADLLLRCGRPEEAWAAVDGLSESRDGSVAYVGAMVLKTLASDRLGRSDDALTALAAALRAASADRIIQPFVAPGPQARPLLEMLLDRGTAHEAMVLEILAHMGSSCGEAAWTSARSPYFVEPLSRRELEVLEKLQSTMTNAEIASALYVTVNTLRTHMKSIDRKLGAANRRDAVRRARELGIL